MCDIFEGQLLLCVRRFDPAGRRLIAQLRDRQIEHVEYLESMDDALYRLNLRPREDLDVELHRVRVPEGQESWKANYLQAFYKHAIFEELGTNGATDDMLKALSSTAFHFTASPNHRLSINASAGGSGTPVAAASFSFGTAYASLQAASRMPAASAPVDTVRVLVADTGIAADCAATIHSQRNFIDSTNPQAIDDHGHGTALVKVIDDSAPGCEFVIFKIGDAAGDVAEWDALAALVADVGAHVVNLSLEFGLRTRYCYVCGRQTMAARSAVFENVLEGLSRLPFQPIVVAAAGNAAAAQLAFPARFGNVLAIGSVNSSRSLSSDSNYGDLDAAGQPHAHHFVCGGGDAAAGQTEDVVTDSSGRGWRGTSFAAAFASAVVATRIGQLGLRQFQRAQFLDDLRRDADFVSLVNGSSVQHGHGIMRA